MIKKFISRFQDGSCREIHKCCFDFNRFDLNSGRSRQGWREMSSVRCTNLMNHEQWLNCCCCCRCCSEGDEKWWGPESRNITATLWRAGCQRISMSPYVDLLTDRLTDRGQLGYHWPLTTDHVMINKCKPAIGAPWSQLGIFCVTTKYYWKENEKIDIKYKWSFTVVSYFCQKRIKRYSFQIPKNCF